MKVIIPTYNRHDIIRTHMHFMNQQLCLVVSNEEQKDLYDSKMELANIPKVVCNITGNIAAKRQWILDNLVEEGEWFVMADDNIRSFQCIRQPWYGANELDETGVKMEVPIDYRMAWEVIEETLAEAKKRGAQFAGFRTNSNPFFGRKKWNEFSYVSTKLCLIQKNSNIRFEPEFPLRDEVLFCAEHLLRVGKVLVNKYMYPVANHYEKGGIGSLDSRLERRKEECRNLMIKYPDLFRFKKGHSTTPEGSDVQFRLNSQKQIENWRYNMFANGIAPRCPAPLPLPSHAANS